MATSCPDCGARDVQPSRCPSCDNANAVASMNPVSASGSVAEVSVSIRTNFSVTHAISAAALTRRTRALEDAIQPGESVGEVRGVATAAIVMSACFVEATINEFFADFNEKHCIGPWLEVLPVDRATLAGQLWESADLDRLKTLEKFDTALALFGRPPLERGRLARQDATLLFQVRNALVHAKPLTNSDRPEHSTKEARDLSAALGSRFKPCRLMSAGNAYFPDHTLGAGGAEWAFAAALRFTDEFFRTLGVASRYQGFRSELSVG